jgi:molecular chaperone GrpE
MRNSPESEAAEQPEGQRQASDADQRSAELERLEDRYKRALADLDNYRKRSAREIARRTEEVREAVIRDWLEAVDSVERAVRLDPDGPCAEGLRAVLEQMETVLARQGAVRIGAAGDRFDPERHEAVGMQPSAELPDRTILSVERSGFALGDRVIRPAQVVVARTPEHVH